MEASGLCSCRDRCGRFDALRKIRQESEASGLAGGFVAVVELVAVVVERQSEFELAVEVSCPLKKGKIALAGLC